MNNNEQQNVVIVGGGITGLVAAYIASKAGHTVTVLEGSSQFGGLLNTFEINGSRLEVFYHHFFTHDAEIHWLLEELGMLDAILYRPTTMGVYRNSKIYDFNGPRDLLGFDPLNLPSKLRFGLTSLFLGKYADWKQYESTSAVEWFYRYAGRQVTEAIWLPLLKIKFGPFYDKVPVAWIVGRLSQRMQSRKGTEEHLGYLNGSLHALLDKLLFKLDLLGVEMVSDAPLQSMTIEQGSLQSITCSGKDWKADRFLFTLPTVYLAPILEKAAGSSASDLVNQLKSIEYFGAMCCILETRQPFSHVYWLNVAEPGFPFGGVIEHTNFVGPENYGGSHLTYLSRYFAWSEPFAELSEDAVKSEMIKALPRIYPDFKEKDVLNVFLFKTRTAATVCDLDFSCKIPSCQTGISKFYLASMCHIYPDERSVNNSVRVAAEACRCMGLATDEVPGGKSLSASFGFGNS